MRTLIPLLARLKRGGGDEIRMFRMNASQASVFEMTVTALVNNSGRRVDAATANQIVEKAVVQCLTTAVIPESAPVWIQRMHAAFPKLTNRQIRELPRHGCPTGPIRAIIFQVQSVQANVMRTVCVPLNHDQGAWFRDMIAAIREREGASKDDAWQWCVSLVARLLTGATPNGECEEPLFLRAVELFPGMDLLDIMRLKNATEEDVMRWTTTRDAART